jgi:hypothetical protein
MVRNLLSACAMSVLVLSPLSRAEASCSQGDRDRYARLNLNPAEIEKLCSDSSAAGAGMGATAACVTGVGLRCTVPAAERGSLCYCNSQKGPLQGKIQ